MVRLGQSAVVILFRHGYELPVGSLSGEAVESMLKSFSQDDRDHMVEDGRISVTCEFCSETYVFAPDDVGAKVN